MPKKPEICYTVDQCLDQVLSGWKRPRKIRDQDEVDQKKLQLDYGSVGEYQ